MRAVRKVVVLLTTGMLFAMACPLLVQAADLSLVEELDFSEIEESMDEILGGEFQFKDIVLELIQGGQPFTVDGFLTAILQQVKENWETEKRILLSILVLGIAAALLHNFSTIFQSQQIAEVSFEITYMLLFLILLQVFTGAAELTQAVLSGIQEFMSALVPAYFLAVTMASGGTTATVFYQFLLGLIYVIEWLIRHGLMTLIQVHMILVFINHLTKEEYLSQMSEMVSKIVGWILKSMLAVVVGFHMIQGMISPAIDSLKTTMFSRAAEVLPGIGNIAGSVTDVILGSAVLIKNGIGVTALIVIILICLVPLAKLGTLVLILDVAAALIQPVSDKRMVGCVAGASEGIKLLFRVAFTTAVLFMLTIVVVTVSTGGKI
ncbi:MAG: stage III sporulation protein AF [Lachnospiraceae bacterium]|nr:stage III sporulation protein AF [Lachnospiraceae bacterium]